MARRRGGFGAMACGVAIGLTMAGGTMLMGQSQRHRLDAEEMWVRKVVIVDERGKVRGVLGMSLDGAAGFTFRDEAGRDRAALDVKAEGPPALRLDGKGGDDDPRVLLWVNDADDAFVSVEAKDEIGLAATEHGGTAITLMRDRKVPAAVWSIDADGNLDGGPVTGRTSPAAASSPARSTRPAAAP